MTAITPYSIYIDNVALNDYAYVITRRTGWDSTPGLVGENTRVPGRDGEIWTAKDYGVGRMVLDIFVSGRDSDGVVPVGYTEDSYFRFNLDKIFSIFGKRSTLLEVVKDIPGNSQRINFAEVGAVITPAYFDNDPSAQITVELIFPQPLWRDLTQSDTGAFIVTSGTNNVLGAFAGSTAPITDSVILVHGPVSIPRITDTQTGAWIQYNGTMPATQTWRIDCANFKSELGPTNMTYTSTTSVTNVIAMTTFNPGPRFLPLTPAATGTTPALSPVANVSGTGMTSATTLSVLAHRRFLA